ISRPATLIGILLLLDPSEVCQSLPPARVTAMFQASVKFLNFLVILFTSAVGDAIFSLRSGTIRGAPPGFRVACRGLAPSGRARGRRLEVPRIRTARRAPRSCSRVAAAAVSRGSAIRGGRPGSPSGGPVGSPRRRAACPNCRRGTGYTTGSADLGGGGT